MANLVNKDVSWVFDSAAEQSPAESPAVVGVVPGVEHCLSGLQSVHLSLGLPAGHTVRYSYVHARERRIVLCCVVLWQVSGRALI